MVNRVKTNASRFKLSTCGAALAGLAFSAGCDMQAGPTEEPVGIAMTPLSGTSCGDTDSPTANANPFVDSPNVTVGVRVYDTTTKLFETITKSTKVIRQGATIKLKGVPEGDDREVIVFAQGATQSWYGRDTGLDIRRNTDNVAEMVLTRFGGLSCVPVPQGVQNTVFPAAATLADGRVLVTGGFTGFAGNKLTDASTQAFLFDPRTGVTEVLGGLPVGAGRAGHAAVYLAATNKVVLIGGMTELSFDDTKPFPYVYDPSKGRDDIVIFDVASKTFSLSGDRMLAKRGFPRTALLSDGTVLITGGGKWPIDTEGTEQIECDMFDPEDNDKQGGLLDIPPLRSFYWRAGHSLSFLGNSAEGLSTYLIWGGTTPDRSLGHPAEIFRQSGRQRDGVNGTFAEVAISGEVPPFSYFHETTSLGGGRFLATGGSRYANGALQVPESDDAWLLTYNSEPAPVLQTRRIAGLGAGRVFHTSLTADNANVSIIGGWGPINASEGVIKTFDLATQSFKSEDAAASLTAGRGGHAAVLTPAGTILLIGGENAATTPAGTKRLAAEIYTPATSPVP